VKHWCLAVAVLMLAGCAGPGTDGREFHQGVPAPRPPVFNPATDAPHTTGQPGHLRPQALPRSPHKRVLPPSTESGVWSAEVPRAGTDNDDPTVSLLGIPFPREPEVSGFAEMQYAQCAEKIHLAADAAGGTARALRLQPAEHICLAHLLMMQCIGTLADKAAASERGAARPEMVRQMNQAKSAIQRAITANDCDSTKLTGDALAFYGRVIQNMKVKVRPE
jgi:hypothetical protein